MQIITLTSDFGIRDWFAGTMKGVIAGIAPGARVIDITHEVAAGSITGGAYALAAACRFFPRGTIHVAVVDPGVGSGRAAIAVKTRTHCFIGPDNGVLSLALWREEVREIRRIENEAWYHHPVSRTFHGRDVFAPVAAHLADGAAFSKVGPPAEDFVRLPWPEPRVTTDGVRGVVVHVDRFGNAITNIPEALLSGAGDAAVLVSGRQVARMAEFYHAVPAGQPVAVVSSGGFLEVAAHGGNAAKKLRLRTGTVIVVRWRRAP